MNIEQTITSSYDHQRNGQGKVYIQFVKQTIKKCLDTNNGLNLALFQIRSKPMGVRLPSPSMLLFNRPKRGLLPE